MSEKPTLEFGDDSVAKAYDNGLVPVLFDPWAARLVEDHGPWEGRSVVDLASGTGIVAYQIGQKLGASGKLIAADINAEMLNLARQRCADLDVVRDFVVCPADSLDCLDDSVDRVVCQQGFQFFPDKARAAGEIFRVLKSGGKAVVSTWRPVDECQMFGAVCEALEAIGEEETSAIMRVPFDHLPSDALESHFNSAGFEDVQLTRPSMDFVLSGGDSHIMDIAYSTPIAPRLKEMSEEKRGLFKAELLSRTDILRRGGDAVGVMASDILTARKPG